MCVVIYIPQERLWVLWLQFVHSSSASMGGSISSFFQKHMKQELAVQQLFYHNLYKLPLWVFTLSKTPSSLFFFFLINKSSFLLLRLYSVHAPPPTIWICCSVRLCWSSFLAGPVSTIIQQFWLIHYVLLISRKNRWAALTFSPPLQAHIQAPTSE